MIDRSFIPKQPPRLVLSVLFSAVPPAALLILLLKYGTVNIPVWDDWDVLPLLEKYSAGTLTFHDFWTQHNEHRLLFPRILFLAIGVLSRYNVWYEIAANFILACLIYAALIFHIQNNKDSFQIADSSRWLWIFFSFFVFSLGQYQNWTWGFQIQWYLNLLAVTAGALILSNDPIQPTRFFMTGVCGVIATGSLSSGMVFWIIIFLFLIILFLKTHKNQYLQYAGVWGAWFIAVILAYLYDYQKPQAHPSLLFLIEHPIAYLQYVFAYLGAPLCPNHPISLAIGCGGFGLILFAGMTFHLISKLPHHQLQRFFFFIALGLYSIFTAGLTGVGRAGFGVSQAMESRYVTMSSGLWISLFFMMFLMDFQCSFQNRMIKLFVHAGLVFIFVMLNLKSFRSIPEFRTSYQQNLCAQDAVLSGENPDCLKFLYPDQERLIHTWIPLLKRLQLSVFSSEAQSLEPRVLHKIQIGDWRKNGSWAIRGTYPNGSDIYFWGSWNHKTGGIGEIYSNEIPIQRAVILRMLVTHGSDVSRQKIGIRILGKEPIEMLCDLQYNGDIRWMPCLFDLSSYVGRSFIVFAEDSGEEWGQFIGFTQPALIGHRKNHHPN